MKTKTELDHHFEYKDNPEFTKKLKRDLILICCIIIGASVMILTTLCYADVIDMFFQKMLAKLM